MANISVGLSVLDRTPVTPVAHVFTGANTVNGVGLLRNTTGVAIRDEKVTLSMRRSGSNFRGKLTFTLPVVVDEVISGVSQPKVVRTAFVSTEVTFHEGSTLQERTNAMGMLADAFGTSKTFVHDSFVNLNGVT